jgi:hypothetical protein
MRVSTRRSSFTPIASLVLVAVAAVGCTSHHTAAGLSGVSALPSASSDAAASSGVTAPPSSSQPAPTSASLAAAPTLATPGAPAPSGSAVAASTADSAQAYVRAYFAALNASLTSHSYTALQNFFEPTCTICQTTIDTLKQITFQQETLRGGNLIVSSVGPVVAQTGGKVVVTTVTTEAAGEVVGANGGVSSTFKALPPTKIAYTLQPNGSTWIIVDSAQVS